ncbi:hypothetical protein SUGI_0091500 [Cryptomeria japonica]|nr:hypothetical protein SUGI_0091500 [Cryptomeria japonica]
MAHIVSDEAMLFVGVVILAICISIDVGKAYKRGAIWLPGYAVLIYAFCLQLIGYLDVQNVTIGSTHEDQQLEVFVSNQVSIDISRLVLLVFVGYLVSNLASTHGFWPNIAALFTSLSTHIAIEMSVALRSRVNEKDKVVKGQSGIWLIVSGFVMLESIFLCVWLLGTAIVRGRFIRDNLGSRIPLALESPEKNNETISRIRLALESPEDNNDTISKIRLALKSLENNNESSSWDTYQSEMLKSWIVARVSQPEYVLNRSFFSLIVLCLVTFDVMFMGVKVILLRSLLHGPFPLFTLQCIFIILGWSVVYYRFFSGFVKRKRKPSQVQRRGFGIDSCSLKRSLSPIFLFRSKILDVKNLFYRSVAYIGFALLILLYLLLVCIMVIGEIGAIGMIFVSLPMVLFVDFVARLKKKFCPAPPEDEDKDFPSYREALERVCMPEDDAKNLWVENRSSFNDIRQSLQQAYADGRNCKILQKVIGIRLAQNIHRSEFEHAKELLEPLESVNRYFPLLKGSFRRITAFYLLRMMWLMDDLVPEDEHSMRHSKQDICTAFEVTVELMNFLDCPDNVGISIDVFNISNLEAFVLRNASISPFQHMSFKFKEPPTNANVRKFVEKLFNDAKIKLEMCNLLGAFNSRAVDTDWDVVAEPYVMYKICKRILDRPLPHSVQQLEDDLFNMFADLIAMWVRESPQILLEHSRKWASEFREEKISAAVKLAGFACGLIDKAEEQHPQQPV